jgi:hypothetical protein
MTWDALQGLGSKQLPNWLVTSSLDLLKGEKLDRFAVTLKEALKHG